MMMLLLAAAQRDSAEFDRPDDLRSRSRSVPALGVWPRTALLPGCAAGPAGGRVALSAVTARFPDARLDGEPRYKPNVTLRGLSHRGDGVV